MSCSLLLLLLQQQQQQQQQDSQQRWLLQQLQNLFCGLEKAANSWPVSIGCTRATSCNHQQQQQKQQQQQDIEPAEGSKPL
ncbi:hypothetical protein ACSSS7_002083 [Eimeria intestinalis]